MIKGRLIAFDPRTFMFFDTDEDEDKEEDWDVEEELDEGDEEEGIEIEEKF